MRARWLPLLIIAAWLVFVVHLTMFAPPATLESVHEPVADHVSLRTVEMLLNVALFVPLGAALAWLGRPRWLLAAVALSVAIELVQLTLPDRQTELIDVVTNSVGAVIGYTAVRALRRRRGAAG